MKRLDDTVRERERPRIIVALSILGILLAVAACDSGNGGSRVAESESDRQALTREPAAPASSKVVVPSREERSHPDRGEVRPDVIEQESLELINGAARANGGTTCEQVYAGMSAMADFVGEVPPEQEAFLQTCSALPDQIQQCMLPSYRIEHMEACDQAYSNLDPELDAAMSRLWGERNGDEGSQ
jgi:hypothetical protein